MKPILVTGGAGYIGSHTVQKLTQSGAGVVVLDNLTTGHLDAVRTRHFYEGDIADIELVNNIVRDYHIESVIHFAAKSLVGESYQKPELYFRENTIKSFAFFEAAIKAGVKNIVFSSSAAVYGVPQTIPIQEDSLLAPVNPYGASKRMIEEYLAWMGKVHGTRWVALRYFNAAGASCDAGLGEDHQPETHLIPLVMKTILGQREKLRVFGTDYTTPDGTCIRDYIHVMDLANAHILSIQALEQGLPGQVFNVGTGKGYSVMDIIQTIQKITGRPLAVEYEPRRPGDPPVLVADSGALNKIMDWKPRFSDLHTILASAWQWHRAHPFGFADK